MDITELNANMTTALGVLKDHGTEFTNVCDEQHRQRLRMDAVSDELISLRKTIDDKTHSRFYKSDGDRLENRIERLENRVFVGK